MCDAPDQESNDDGAAAFRDWVQQTVWGSSSTHLSCTDKTCTISPAPLPDNTRGAEAFSPYTPVQSACYYYNATINNFEVGFDFATVAGIQYSGTDTAKGHWCGALPLAWTTDYSVQSGGLSITASNPSTAYNGNGGPSASLCRPATRNAWAGCGANSCAVCVHELVEYPRYFVNHPNCAPDLVCNHASITCSDQCPAPSAADK